MSIVKATLIKRETEDGLFSIKDHLQLGIVYEVDTSTIRTVNGFNTVHKELWEREIIVCTDGQWFPTELLEIDTP